MFLFFGCGGWPSILAVRSSTRERKVQYCFVVTKIGNIRQQRFEEQWEKKKEDIRLRFHDILQRNGCVPTVFNFFGFESLLWKPEMLRPKGGQISSDDFYDGKTMSSALDLIGWLSDRMTKFSLADELFPLPPKFDSRRKVRMRALEQLLTEKEKTIASFDEALSARYALQNNLKRQKDDYEARMADAQSTLNRFLKDDTVDIWVFESKSWVNFTNVTQTHVVKKELKRLGYEVLYRHNCSVSIQQRTTTEFELKVERDQISFWTKSFKDYQGTMLVAVKFVGEPKEIHATEIEKLSRQNDELEIRVSKLAVEEADAMNSTLEIAASETQ